MRESSPATRGGHSASWLFAFGRCLGSPPWLALAPLPQHLARNMVPLAGSGGKTSLQRPPTGSSATADGGGVGQLPREVQQLPHGVLAVGGLADPQREVIGRDRAEVTVISLAALVTAVRGLKLQVGKDV